VLAATDRRLLLGVLAPPEGYTLDQALGTTYSLDLLALLRVPLAATTLPWSSSDGGPIDNPFALLTALRRVAGRISLYCHAGATSVPARHVPLLAFLEDAIHPVTPPRPGGVFHPKVWVLRFAAAPGTDDDPVRYRLVVLSRNLTFDRSWDVALALDGDLHDRQRGFSLNRPLADLVAALPAMARAAGHEPPQAASDRAALLATELRRVDWSLPEGFDEYAFHPLGLDGRSRWPFEDLSRLLVIAPFVEGGALARLRDTARDGMELVSRYDELTRLAPEQLCVVGRIDAFDDPAPLLDVEDEAAPSGGDAEQVELSGLHAKVFVGERARRAVAYVGSANATEAAFDRNVELLVELRGSRSQHGIAAVRTALEDAGLLRPYTPAEPLPEDEGVRTLERQLDRAAHALATGPLVARAAAVSEDTWRLTLHRVAPVDVGDLTIVARPLSSQLLRRVDLEADPCCGFPPTGLSSVTPFFAFRISGRVDGTDRRRDVAIRLRLEGAPEGRSEAVTAELLADRDRLLLFVLLLLADDHGSDRALEELAAILVEQRAGRTPAGDGASLGFPLLEPLLRAMHRDPRRLDEIERLISDVRSVGGSAADLVPADLERLLETVRAAREER
jgi:hypothetical protein